MPNKRRSDNKICHWNKFLKNGGKAEQKGVISYYFLRRSENLEERSGCRANSGKRSLYQPGL